MFLKRKIIGLLLLLPATAMAGESDVDTQNLLQPNFQFQHQTINLGNSSTTGQELSGARQLFDRDNSRQGQIKQYDAMITYPFGHPDRAVNFDLGINIRFIDVDFKSQAVESQAHRFNAAIPMFHATALFNLPYNGLSASLGGSHIEYDQYRAFDYKAKLSYSWQNGFGLEGGWQHQQMSIDGSDYQTEFEVKGPFLDLKYRF